MSDHAAPVPIADERTRRIFGDLSFSSAKKGFDPAEVTAFLVNASGAVERMLGRLKDAEQRAEQAEARITELEARALQGPSLPAPPAPPANGDGNGLLDRTLALAEKTAIAAVADARARAQAILTQAQEQAREYFASERAAIASEWERVQNEASQLETLRLAVAAETMALEGVRSHLRARIAATAQELATIADNPDLLSYAIAQARTEVEAPVAPVGPAAATAIEAPEDHALPSPHADAIPASSVSSYEKTFEAKWAHEEEDQADAEAFERFFSDEVEPEPTQQWILAG